MMSLLSFYHKFRQNLFELSSSPIYLLQTRWVPAKLHKHKNFRQNYYDLRKTNIVKRAGSIEKNIRYKP